MNISSDGNIQNNKIFNENINGKTKDNTPFPAQTSLSMITDSSSLSTVAPQLQALLNAIDQPEGNVLTAMNDNISRLQDGFIETLYAAISTENINLSEKITLRLDGNERLKVLDDHVEKNRIEAILDRTPELSSAFKEIATQSEILRDVANIGKVIASQNALTGYQKMQNQTFNSNYQISLKGEMSHFYFSR